MSAALPSDEVALDFQDSLQDLQNNNRYEISNLTVIAKEHTEHAQAISQVLEKHIRTTAPTRKLPALYVLDSIVKNVGTPYTVYLGRNLFSTFMDAYTLVGGEVRKAMDAMLKTWKEPVPGSMDTRPVFPLEVTRTIENALIKARTVAVQQQQQQSRNQQRPPMGLIQRPMSSAYRNTPTPPQNGSHYPPPPQGQYSYQNGYPNQQPTPQPQPAGLAPDVARSLAALLNPPQDDLTKLKADIDGLVTAFRTEFARSPFDTNVQSKLKALLDLQNVVNTQRLPAEAIGLIKAQVSALQAAQPQPPPQSATPSFMPAQATSQWQPPTPVANPFQPPPQPPQAYAPSPSVQPPPPVIPNFAPGVLEQLLKSATNGQKPNTPTLQAALPALQNLSMPPITQSPRPAAATPLPVQQTGNSLLDALRAAGIVQGTSTSAPAATPAPLQPAAPLAPTLLQQLQGLGALGHANPSSANSGKIRISLSAPNFKTFRPELISTLYDAQPNQCTTCGRRFPATEPGRAKKARHLDWHFRTNQRIADASHKGQNRSWYIDEMEWIQLPDIDFSAAPLDAEDNLDGGAVGGVAGAGVGGGKARKRDVKESYIAAPTGAAAVQNAACPICQERFETVWHDEAQEWVWMDARRVGGRVYHASCHEEVSKASGAGGMGGPGGPAGFVLGLDRARSQTPDGSVLGKRKADGADLNALKAKLKREVAT